LSISMRWRRKDRRSRPTWPESQNLYCPTGSIAMALRRAQARSRGMMFACTGNSKLSETGDLISARPPFSSAFARAAPNGGVRGRWGDGHRGALAQNG
jgi:hypothetical protein